MNIRTKLTIFVLSLLMAGCSYWTTVVTDETVIPVSGQEFKVPGRLGVSGTALDLCVLLGEGYNHNKNLENPGYIENNDEVVFVRAYGVLPSGKELDLGYGRYYLGHLEQCFTVGVDSKDLGFEYVAIRPTKPLRVKEVVWRSHLYL